MSDMAQKRDISDPRTVSDFAGSSKCQKVKSTILTVSHSKCRTRYLEQLKATLIRQLYAETKAILEQVPVFNRENRRLK